MNRLMERVPFLEKYGYWLPLVFGVCAVAQCLSSYFQLDDFAIICALRYDYPEPINWFAVWPSGFWRPFQLAVLWSEIRLFGSSPAGYRIVHGIYFLLAIYLYHRLTERVSGSRTTGLIAGLLFASTYSHWEAVQWICASSELWTGLWCLVMLTAFLNVRDTHQPAWIGAAITAHTLALLTKESAVVLLPISLLLLYHQQALAMLKRPWFILGILAPWLASLLWRIKLTITGGAVNDGLYSLSGNHPIHNLGAFVLRKIVPWIHAPSMLEALGVVVVLGITLSILWNRRATLPLIGSLWMLLGLAPFLGFNLGGVHPGRYTYLAGMGIYLTVAIGLNSVIKRSPFWRNAGTSVLIVYCIINLLLYSTHREKREWLKHDSLYRGMVEELQRLDLPPLRSIAVKNVQAPPVFDDFHASFRTLFALAYPPPPLGKVWAGEGPWPETPDVILEWKEGKFIILKESN